MSCGALLLAAGKLRYAAPSMDIMVHEASSGTMGKTTDIVNDVRNVSRLNDKYFSLLDEFSKKPKGFFKDQVRRRNNADWFIDAKEAKALGLVDHIGIPSLVRG